MDCLVRKCHGLRPQNLTLSDYILLHAASFLRGRRIKTLHSSVDFFFMLYKVLLLSKMSFLNTVFVTYPNTSACGISSIYIFIYCFYIFLFSFFFTILFDTRAVSKIELRSPIVWVRREPQQWWSHKGRELPESSLALPVLAGRSPGVLRAAFLKLFGVPSCEIVVF